MTERREVRGRLENGRWVIDGLTPEDLEEIPGSRGPHEVRVGPGGTPLQVEVIGFTQEWCTRAALEGLRRRRFFAHRMIDAQDFMMRRRSPPDGLGPHMRDR